MDEQFKSTIKKAFRQINNGNAKFGIDGISQNELTSEPRFFKTENNGIDCFQHDYLGFYVLRAAYRGILLSINFLVAGDNSLDRKLLGPSIASYYSCAYQILGAFLALKGRVIFDRQIVWDDKTLESEDQFAIASFTNGKWNIQKKKWGHAGKWREIKQLRLSEYPESMVHLFKYWFKFRTKEDISMTEYLSSLLSDNKVGTPVDINDLQNEFLNKITTSRHASIYESFGSEPEVMANMVNGDVNNDNGIDFQAKAYQRFCYEFLTENVSELVQVIEEIEVVNETKMYLRLAIVQPWFDEQQLDLLQNSELRTNLKTIKSWLFN